MGLLENATLGGIAWLGIKAFRAKQETRRRKSSPLSFVDGITQEDFADLVAATARHTPRVVQAKVVGMAVHLRIESNSGLSCWSAEVDLNDYGRLTGSYWISSENSDSRVPRHFAEMLSTAIEELVSPQEEEERGQTHASKDSPEHDIGSANGTRPVPAGWYRFDARLRYWDGSAWTPNFAPTGQTAYAPVFDAAVSRPRPSGAITLLAWIITLATCGYMLPWAIAVTRGTSNQTKVGLVCLLTGWTLIGWVVALLMASSRN